MAKRQQSQAMKSKEMSGTRGRANMNKSSSKSSNNRRSKARIADDPSEQMQAAMPSDSTGQRNGRARSSKQRSGVRAKKSGGSAKTTKTSRTRSAR